MNSEGPGERVFAWFFVCPLHGSVRGGGGGYFKEI